MKARLRVALALAALSGFVALSYEIVWVRVFAFLTWSRAQTFGLLLGAYLAGIALGAFVARRWCDSAGHREVRALALFLGAANLAAFVLIPVVAELGRVSSYPWALPLFGFVAALLGTGLPLIAHFGIPPGERVGARLSYLYLANILGSAAGSLLTGFVLLDVASLRGVSVTLALVGLAMTAGAALLAGMVRSLVAIAALAAVAVLAAPPLFDGVYEKLTFGDEYRPGRRFALVVETRSGVVTVDREGVVRGGAVYDGRFNVDPLHDTNDVIRAYAVFALSPQPREVCIVGLGSGSWAQVLVHHPSVKRLVVIEINRGYLQAVASSPVVESLLDNPRVEMVIDDGRRWLARTRRRFDVIVQNTTYHWHAHATNLLSREYLSMCKQRLVPGGVLLYNTTHSLEAQRTGLELFRKGWLLERAMLVTDAEIEPDFAGWRKLLRSYEIDGRRIVDPEDPTTEDALLQATSPTRWIGQKTLQARIQAAGARTITDDNMACEWK